MKRTTKKLPGYDCERGPCPAPDCPGERGRRHPKSHGIHGDEWHYVVIHDDGQFSAELVVFTNVFPETVPAAQRVGTDYPFGATLIHCCAWPTSEDETKKACPFIGSCYTANIGYLGAHELFKEHGGDDFEQSEAFWEALEADSIAARQEATPRC